jgi:2-dehydro-3-deoxyphosphogluconate aldolase/(4S)-4-hydroxy-2-oxoglutarate aldolase
MNDLAVAHALRRSVVADSIRQHRLIVVLRRIEPRSELIALVDDLAEAGAHIFEVTFDSPTAAEDLAVLRAHLAQRLGGPYLVGAGTILSAAQLDHAHRAGATFAVSPILNPDLVGRSVRLGLPFIPGALTPTEVHAAWGVGATFVKLFPASAVGPQAVREIRGPLREIELIPTGGVDADNARPFLDAGAVAVGIGSALVRAGADERRVLIEGLTR